jgi:hypothetical protein
LHALLENADFRVFIALLNSNGAKFLIVGGHAVKNYYCRIDEGCNSGSYGT